MTSNHCRSVRDGDFHGESISKPDVTQMSQRFVGATQMATPQCHARGYCVVHQAAKMSRWRRTHDRCRGTPNMPLLPHPRSRNQPPTSALPGDTCLPRNTTSTADWTAWSCFPGTSASSTYRESVGRLPPAAAYRWNRRPVPSFDRTDVSRRVLQASGIAVALRRTVYRKPATISPTLRGLQRTSPRRAECRR